MRCPQRGENKGLVKEKGRQLSKLIGPVMKIGQPKRGHCRGHCQ